MVVQCDAKLLLPSFPHDYEVIMPTWLHEPAHW